MKNNTFSNNLKRFRLQKKLTQEQVADILGVNYHTVSRWECGTTLPDVMILPEIAKLYCVAIDDLYKERSVAYENNAQRLASIYESTRKPDDFILADIEFQKLLKTNNFTIGDLRTYGIIHQYMMNYCISKSTSLFDEILKQETLKSEETYWTTKRQKLLLYSQIGKGSQSIKEQLEIINSGKANVQEWICLIAAYRYNGFEQEAYSYFKKAILKYPDNAILYVYGGDACKNLKLYDKAFEYWNKAIELDSSVIAAKYSIADCYKELGELEKATDMYKEIAKELNDEGYDIEAEFPQKEANDCLEKIQFTD